MSTATLKTAFAASMIATTALALSIPDYEDSFCNKMKDAMAVFGCANTCCKTLETEIVLSPDNPIYTTSAAFCLSQEIRFVASTTSASTCIFSALWVDAATQQTQTPKGWVLG
jgi:hypothetical protein